MYDKFKNIPKSDRPFNLIYDFNKEEKLSILKYTANVLIKHYNNFETDKYTYNKQLYGLCRALNEGIKYTFNTDCSSITRNPSLDAYYNMDAFPIILKHKPIDYDMYWFPTDKKHTAKRIDIIIEQINDLVNDEDNVW